MGRTTNIHLAESGVEALKAVHFNNKGYVQGDFTGLFNFFQQPQAYAVELYVNIDALGVNQNIIRFGVNATDNASRFTVFVPVTNRLRFGYFRQGGFFYRRDYNIPHGQYIHALYVNNPARGGSAKERFFLNGVSQSSASSAYVASGPRDLATHINIGNIPAGSQPFAGKLAYCAFYLSEIAWTESQAAPYFNSRLDLNARRANKPIVTGVDKPEMFFTANDINDLSVGWQDSNAGVFANENGTLTNTDIIPVI